MSGDTKSVSSNPLNFDPDDPELARSGDLGLDVVMNSTEATTATTTRTLDPDIDYPEEKAAEDPVYHLARD